MTTHSFDEATGEILYRTRPSRSCHPLGEVARWDVYDFIARVLDHLPPPHFQLVRYWGFYSNVCRGKRRRAAAAAQDPARPGHPTDFSPLPLPPPDDEPHRRRARLSWAQLIKKIYEIDPLLCPYCGSQMKIIAFLTEYPTIHRILDHIHMPPQRPDPLAHSPPAARDSLDFELLDIPA